MTKKLFFFSLLALLGIAMHAQEVGESNLLNITNYPYLQVPVSQVLPAGKVKNTGTTTLTNLILTAKIDGNIVGTSAFLADLEPGETAELPLSPAVNFPEGENVITYTITQDGICEISEKNLYTFTVMGTPNLFAIDNATATSASISNTSSNTYFGNIFEVTSTTAISQVIIGFATNYNVNFNIALYEMTGDLTVSSTPLFSQTASKNATGFLFYTVPTTVMTPGQ
ncbi:MAG: hypothetical protein FWC10_01470, partial [Lentimicrobiaceae bacterium]|nr:hypothetical protein [Lentimicrobiaceae bacterium]